jgi:hypothetical protein
VVEAVGVVAVAVELIPVVPIAAAEGAVLGAAGTAGVAGVAGVVFVVVAGGGLVETVVVGTAPDGGAGAGVTAKHSVSLWAGTEV